MSPSLPSDASALILRIVLPPALEALRLRHVDAAREGLPAHLTLLFPFADPASIDRSVLAAIRGVARRHDRLRFDLARRDRWPTVLFASVEPADAAVRLQGDLAAAFPGLPVYGGRFTYEPHVTIVEGPGVEDDAVERDPAWDALPVTVEAREVELLVRGADRWEAAARFALGG